MHLSALDRLEILELQSLYAYGIDHKDGAAFARAFAPDVDADYPGLVHLRGLEDFTRWMDAFHAVFTATQHLISNCWIDVRGDEVILHSEVSVALLREGHPGGDLLRSGAYYVDRIVRTPAGWRIGSRRVGSHWQAGNLGVIEAGMAAVTHLR
jgi:hypothetical protein